jgi:signal transduction histidine kinase
MSETVGTGGALPASVSDYGRDSHLASLARKALLRSLVESLVTMTPINLLLAWAHYPVWRIFSLSGVTLTIVAVNFILVTWGRARNPKVFVLGNLLVNAFVILGGTVLVGGLHGPMIVSLPLLPLGSAVLYGWNRVTAAMCSVVVVTLVLLALLPEAIFGPVLPTSKLEVITCVTVLFTMANVVRYMLQLVAARQAGFQSLQELREDQLVGLRSNLARIQLVSSKIAHELKNPLTTIKGLVQLVGRSSESPSAGERLDVVLRELSRMEVIIRDYLSFARPLESLTSTPTNLADIAGEVVDILSSRAEAAGVALVNRCTTAPLQGDARRLKEAIINLVSNAIEATPPGGTVVVQVHPRDHGAALEIRDTGRGIAEQDLEKMGTPFFTTRAGGTGLGFVMARSVIEQHGGQFSIASSPGQGTTITIALPATPFHAQEPLSGLEVA